MILRATRRFLHNTWLGKKIVAFMWHGLADSSVSYAVNRDDEYRLNDDLVVQFQAAGVPTDSPLRNTVSPYWHIRVNDEGIPRPNGFHGLAVNGKIGVVSPARMAGYAKDGRSILLDDGQELPTSAVVLATGYTSSWSTMFNGEAPPMFTGVLSLRWHFSGHPGTARTRTPSG